MLLFGIQSISQMRLCSSFYKRVSEKYPDAAFVAQGLGAVGQQIIENEAKKLNLSFAIQQPSKEEIQQAYSMKCPSPCSRVINIPPFFFKKKYNVSKWQALYYMIQSELMAATSVIQKFKPNIIIVGEDGVSSNSFLINAAKNHHIPVVILPYEASGKEDYINAIREKIESGSVISLNPRVDIIHKIIKKRLSHWILDSHVGDVLFLPAEIIYINNILGFDIPNPWTVHGGNATVLVAESDAMYQHYLSEGVLEDKIRICGSVYSDVIYDALRSNSAYTIAYESYSKIEKNKTKILISFPPSSHLVRPGKNEFDSYRSMVENVIAMLRRYKLDVTFSLHPATLNEDVRSVKQLGVVLSQEDILTLIPKHDIYLSFFSSTIRWAFAVNKPVLNYDAYKQRLMIFDKQVGFYNYERLDDLEEKLKFLLDDDQYSRVASSLGNTSLSWAFLDGNNTERICSLLESILDS